MEREISIKDILIIPSPIWVMPVAVLICNTSHQLFSLTYGNGGAGFFIFLSFIPLLGIASFYQVRSAFDPKKVDSLTLIFVSVLLSLIGLCLTVVAIFTGGWTIA